MTSMSVCVRSDRVCQPSSPFLFSVDPQTWGDANELVEFVNGAGQSPEAGIIALVNLEQGDFPRNGRPFSD
jgi:hypothetical protein